MDAQEVKYAGFGSRLWAYIIDQSIIQTIALIILTPYLVMKWDVFKSALDQYMALMNPQSMMTMQGAGEISEELLTVMLMVLLFYVALVIVIGLAYGAVMEGGERGSTYGKRYCKIRVADLEGQRISMGAAITRNVGVTLPAVTANFDLTITILLCLVYTAMVLAKRKQTIYDLAAKTVVVRC